MPLLLEGIGMVLVGIPVGRPCEWEIVVSISHLKSLRLLHHEVAWTLEK